MANFETHKKRLIQAVIVFGFLAAGQTATSQEMMNCEVAENLKEFHITTPPIREDLRPNSLIGAEGGEGSLSTLIAQQVTSDGKNVIEFDADGMVYADGIEAQLIAADFEAGAISFEACTESGFLILAVYRAEDGSLAGVPSSVLGSNHSVNYANITDTSDQRVGVRFNHGGAEETLQIIQNALNADGISTPTIGRVIAQNILINNVTNVFDFSESQAPVFYFDQSECFVQDRFVLLTNGSLCTGFANPAVSNVLKSSGESVMELSSGRVQLEIGNVYVAQIGNDGDARRVLFASARHKADTIEEPVPDVDNVFRDCDVCPTMVHIPAGIFSQGSPETEEASSDRERPIRQVNVAAFAIAQTEVTFAQWDPCVDDGFCANIIRDESVPDNAPVSHISWQDAQAYVNWLSAKTGKDYRLPSESEWEYAARAGTTGRFNTGNCISTNQANFDGSRPASGCPASHPRLEILPVAGFSPNAFALYDTHGNLLEWVQDCFNSNYSGAPINGAAWMAGDCGSAVLKGGSYTFGGDGLRSAWRGPALRTNDFRNVGLRVARTLTGTLPPVVTPELGDALDSPSLTWTTGGRSVWYPQSTEWQVGGSAATSGDIEDDQSSWIETTVRGPGRIRFRWRVSSESGFDYLSFYMNEFLITNISGEVEWTVNTYDVPNGNHTLRWEYKKDESVSSRDDRGWLDEVMFEPR